MYLDQGFPIGHFAPPPEIRSDYKNGQDLLYRPIDANKRPYSHQWNITVDRELGRQIALSAGVHRQRRPPVALEYRCR